MDKKILFDHLDIILSLTGLAYLFFWRYKEYRLDCLRQDLFDLRSELFDEAKEGLVEFDHPIYGLLRSTINGFIRFGHRISVLQILALIILVGKRPKTKKSFGGNFEQFSKSLNEYQHHRFVYFRERMNFLVSKHLLLNSIFLTGAIIIPLTIYFFTKGLVKRYLMKPEDTDAALLAKALGNYKRIEFSVDKPISKVTNQIQFDEVDTVAYSYGAC